MTPCLPAQILRLALLAIGLTACGREAPPVAVDTDSIVASSWPLGLFAERVAGPDFQVHVVLPAGVEPEHWAPDRPALKQLHRAGLVILNGAAFEPWAERTSLPLSRLVRTANALRDQWIEHPDATHSHGPKGAHSHGTIDPYTWLDPLLAKAQAGAIRDALAERHGDKARAVEERFAALAAELDELDAGWRAFTAALDGRRLLSAQRTYQYLARRHGWNLVTFDLDPNRLPGDKQLTLLGSAAKDSPALAVLWRSQPIPTVARAVTLATGLPNVVLSPAALPPPADQASDATYLDVQRTGLARLLQLCDPNDQ